MTHLMHLAPGGSCSGVWQFEQSTSINIWFGLVWFDSICDFDPVREEDLVVCLFAEEEFSKSYNDEFSVLNFFTMSCTFVV